VRSLSGSAYWDGSYADGSLESAIYAERERRVLDWIEGLELAPGARVLDAGCGAGRLAAALGLRGFAVSAVDASPEMVALARENGVEAELGDAQTLGFPDDAFELVLGIGLLPWLSSPIQGLRELARVLRPGGYVILTTDNPRRLSWFLDPRHLPWLAPLRRALRPRRQRLHTPRQADGLLAQAGLEKARGETLGFGPFTFLGRRMLASPRLEARLQAMADGGTVGLRASGRQYLALARKPK